MDRDIRTILKKIRILKTSKSFLDKILNKHREIVNGFGSRKKCFICGRTFYYFSKYRGGSRKLSAFIKNLDVVGSDVDNFWCMYCRSQDRERHLFMFFDKLMLWEKMNSWKILHFAPERHLQIKISEQEPYEYIKADLYPQSSDIKKIDATAIPFLDNMFDFLIANHILEHIIAIGPKFSWML